MALWCEQRNYVPHKQPDNIKINLNYSEFKKCQLVLRFPTDYPKEAILIDLKGIAGVAPKLVELLGKRSEKHVADLIKDGKFSAFASLVFIDNILLNNNLIPCWPEFSQIKPLISKNDTLKPLEKAGKLVVTLTEGTFKIVVEFLIPPSYPMQSAKMTIKESNFHPKFA